MKTKKTLLFLITYTAICISVIAQCPDKKCSDTFAEWGFEMQIVDDAYIPVITNTDEDCYITLQSENPKLNSILAKYNIVNFYRYIGTLHTGDPFIDQAYILVCDEGQFELGEELRDSFPNAIPYIGHWECFAQLTNSASNIFSKKSDFYQYENYLIFSESILRTISFYSIEGKKTYSIKSTEKEINPSLYLKQKGVYLIEIIENDKTYSGKYINF